MYGIRKGIKIYVERENKKHYKKRRGKAKVNIIKI